MATLRAHGSLIGKITYLTYTTAHMSDGKILRSYGTGWKRYRKVEAPIDPGAHYRAKVANIELRLKDRPAWTEYRRTLHKLVCTRHWSRVHTVIEMLGDDVDGCWSELDLVNIKLDVSEVAELCSKYKAMREELEAAKTVKP